MQSPSQRGPGHRRVLSGRRCDVDEVQVAGFGIEELQEVSVDANSRKALGRQFASFAAHISDGHNLYVRHPSLGPRPLRALAVCGDMAFFHDESIANDGTA
jgi:hypothetical protein